MKSGQSVKLMKVGRSDYKFLYELLKQRSPKANISHRKMPTYKEHEKFVNSRPYKIWYVIYVENTKTGSIYLSKQNEIGIFLLKKHQGKSIGQTALDLLMIKNPQKRYLANVSPKNPGSIKFFKKNKFKLIQHTYELVPNG
jgi:RimJ/RimL family protein N-acetyltransferase